MDFTRAPRLPSPPIDGGPVIIEPPPALPQTVAVSPLARLMPVAMIAATVAMVALYVTSAGANRNPMFAVFPAMMLISAIGSLAYGARSGQRSAELDEHRRDYLYYLDDLADVLDAAAQAQRAAAWWCHPDPRGLWTLVGTERMWERGRVDADFGHVRVGLGELPAARSLIGPEVKASEAHDPVTAEALEWLLANRTTVPALPVTVDLSGHERVVVLGERELARGVVRALVCQLVVLHGPNDVAVAAVVDRAGAAAWDWLKWLPHHRLSSVVDAAGSARRTHRSLDGVECGAVHRTIAVVDGGAAGDGAPVAGVTAVAVGERPGAWDSASVLIVDLDSPGALQPDDLTELAALCCARRLARYQEPAGTRSDAREWGDLIGIGNPGAATPQRCWTPRSVRSRLRIVVGVDESGQPVELDLKEAAHGGMGPHGLCIGATGSGKSEFLRTLTLGLVATHPPEALNLVLVDFKGGATFLEFERLRHVAAIITNLADEAHLVARMRDALTGELTRRQELLRAAGNHASVGQYEAARSAGAALPALPTLLVVVDEFSELLSAHPEFVDLFVAIGRVGRSLGIHLLLASQRLEEGRLRGLDTHLSYRICLKTFSASESRAVLGSVAAFELSNTPGAAYLRTAAGALIRFQTAYVSGPQPTPMSSEPAPPPAPVPFRATAVGRVLTAPRSDGRGPRTVLEVVVDGLANQGPAAHRVWLPPLDAAPDLGAILEAVPTRAGLTAPIGLVDNPFHQRYEPLSVDLSGAGGHVAIVGGPRSGKSTALQTLLLALAATHEPDALHVYGLDCGGGLLAAMRALPHVGTVASRFERELVGRTVAHVQAAIRRRQTGQPATAGDTAHIVLAIDGWSVIRQDFDGLEEIITGIAAQGLSLGVHVVVTAGRWAELRPAFKDQLGTRLELRLGDPAESELDRRRAGLLRNRPAGHGITRAGLEFAIGLPHWSQSHVAPGGLAEAVEHVRNRHADSSAPAVRLLPERVELGSLIAAGSDGQVLGVEADRLSALTVDFAVTAHLLIIGESRCGKTAALRTICRELMRNNTIDAAQLLVIDLRRTLLEVVDSEHLDFYAMTTAGAERAVATAAELLRSRLPGDAVTQRELRNRSWWSGPELYVIVDDYELVVGMSPNPLLPLLELLPHAGDLGLHLVIARRSGGAARAMFDPVLAAVRDAGCYGLVMSASPEEGVLLGTVRPTSLPAGRGTLVVRGHPDRVVQVAWTDPP